MRHRLSKHEFVFPTEPWTPRIRRARYGTAGILVMTLYFFGIFVALVGIGAGSVATVVIGVLLVAAAIWGSITLAKRPPN